MFIGFINNKSHYHAMEMSVSAGHLGKINVLRLRQQGDIEDCIPLMYAICGDCKEERDERGEILSVDAGHIMALTEKTAGEYGSVKWFDKI